MKTLVNLLRRLFGLPPTDIGAITRPIKRIVMDLDNYTAHSEAKREMATAAANWQAELAEAHAAKAKEARRLAETYSKLLA